MPRVSDTSNALDASDVSDASPALMLESDQGADTFVRHTSGKARQPEQREQTVLARLLSFRCSESQAQSLPCQDYARVLCNQEGSSISFCVCDGVGSSYKGNFAAQYLATCLVDWLQTFPAIPSKSARFLKALHPRLDQWAHEAQEILACFEIPPDLPALVREVLEELRTTYGSETVFFCGRIDLYEASAQRPAKERFFFQRAAHQPRFRALFCWMGNVSARLYMPDQPPIELGEVSNDEHRWSTARGRRGSVTLQTRSFDALDRLLIYTDGLQSLQETLADLDDEALQEQARELLSSATSDDMTLLDLQWSRIISTVAKEDEL